MDQPATAGAVLYGKHIEQLCSFYVECCGLRVAHAEADHVVLDSPGFQLVIVAAPKAIADTIVLAVPPVRRERTPIKLVFAIANIEAVRVRAPELGGELNPVEREWRFQGQRVCDGHDPEGNVVQFREVDRPQPSCA